MRRAVPVSVAAIVFLAVAMPAWAQYPPQGGATTTVVPQATPTTTGGQSGGTHILGASFTTESCGFSHGSPVSVSVDDQPAATKTGDANGCVRTTIHILSGSAADVNDPVRVSIRCGANTLLATGRNSAGATVVQSTSFNVNCAASVPSARTARTGANMLRWSVVAAALLALGGGLVLIDRRRGRRSVE